MNDRMYWLGCLASAAIALLRYIKHDRLRSEPLWAKLFFVAFFGVTSWAGVAVSIWDELTLIRHALEERNTDE